MTMTSRPATRSGYGGGTGEVAVPTNPGRRAATRRRHAALAGGLAVLTTAAGMTAFSGIAHAGTPPTGPGNIEIFNKRSMVALEGYSAQAGQEATVEVLRGGATIGIGVGTLDDKIGRAHV